MKALARFGLLLALSGCAPPPRPLPPSPAGGRLVILVSIDGFRPDYLDRPAAVRLRAIAATGVRANALIPAFPTKTFPNHYTIATGLYPEHHGIVANLMVDSAIGRFSTTDTIGNRDPRWWGGEPIWVTAIKQGRRAATMYWVGSEGPIQGTRPTYWRPFDPRVPAVARVDQVLEWLSLPVEQVPELVTLYFNRVDLIGHRRGPESAAVDSAISDVDTAIGRLVDGLASRDLLDRTNLIVLSDHGMTTIAPDRVIFLDDYAPIEPSEITDLAPATAIDPGPGRTELIYHGLVNAHPHLRVYRRQDIPARFHFRSNPRIAPLLALADDGWTISTRQRWAVNPMTDLGNHGYDNALPSMAAMFIATGPAFRAGAVVRPFQSIHIYELVAYVMGLRPAPNDGALDAVRAVLR